MVCAGEISLLAVAVPRPGPLCGDCDWDGDGDGSFGSDTRMDGA